MNDERGMIPHIHECELKMVKGRSWRRYCPFKGKLSESEEECDRCNHFIIVEFEDDCMTTIKGIDRGNAGDTLDTSIKEDTIQSTAEMIITINDLYDEIEGHKRNINYLLDLSENKIKYEVTNDTFKFQSFGMKYLEQVIIKLKAELDKLSTEDGEISHRIDSDDYK